MLLVWVFAGLMALMALAHVTIPYRFRRARIGLSSSWTESAILIAFMVVLVMPMHPFHSLVPVFAFLLGGVYLWNDIKELKKSRRTANSADKT